MFSVVYLSQKSGFQQRKFVGKKNTDDLRALNLLSFFTQIFFVVLRCANFSFCFQGEKYWLVHTVPQKMVWGTEQSSIVCSGVLYQMQWLIVWILFLQFKYKRRVYKLMQLNPRKLKQLHTKVSVTADLSQPSVAVTCKTPDFSSCKKLPFQLVCFSGKLEAVYGSCASSQCWQCVQIHNQRAGSELPRARHRR